MGKSCPGGGRMRQVQRENKKTKRRVLSGLRILPPGLTGRETVSEMVEKTFFAYNAARLREACNVVVQKMLRPEVTVGISLAGALTPAGLGCSCLVPLIEGGFVDWIVSTGANLYHDLHFAFNLPLYAGSWRVDDRQLRDQKIVRIYDILVGYDECILETDRILFPILQKEEFHRTMGTAELHYRLGRYAAEWEERHGLGHVSVLAAAYRAGVPCYTSAPGDSGLGMDLAGLAAYGHPIRLDPLLDVNETAAIVWNAKQQGGKSAVILLGGGSPKNFVLQTEPHLQDVFGIPDSGHDYFLQITDARPDTGGLSGATPHEAVSWGKVNPNQLPDAVVCYTDVTIALPILTHYVLAHCSPRPLRRLYERREEMLQGLIQQGAQRVFPFLKNKSLATLRKVPCK